MGAGIPPVPEKMISSIEAGEYIEMAELLPDRLGSAGMMAGEDQTRIPRSRRKAVTNIFEWVECFAIYVAVLSRSRPQRVPEMLGYLILILEAHMEHGGDGWIGYDRRFCMTAAGNPSINWAAIDTTLWQLEREKVHDVNIVLVFCIPLMIVNGVRNQVPLLHGLIHQQPSSHPCSSSNAGRFVVIGIIPGDQAVFV